MPVDASPLPPAMPAAQMSAHLKARRRCMLRDRALTAPDNAVAAALDTLDAYRDRAAKLAAMDATRRTIIHAAPTPAPRP